MVHGRRWARQDMMRSRQLEGAPLPAKPNRRTHTLQPSSASWLMASADQQPAVLGAGRPPRPGRQGWQPGSACR